MTYEDFLLKVDELQKSSRAGVLLNTEKGKDGSVIPRVHVCYNAIRGSYTDYEFILKFYEQCVKEIQDEHDKKVSQ